MFKSFTAAVVGPIAGAVDAGVGLTKRQFTLKVASAAPDCSVALETSPDGTTWTEQARATGPNWCYAPYPHLRRFVRANVISLGTNAPPLAAVIGFY